MGFASKGFNWRQTVRHHCLPDVLVMADGKPIFVELKSRAGVASTAQKQVRAELIAAGAQW